MVQSWIFGIITLFCSVTWFFRNHFDMIWCLRNISSYYYYHHMLNLLIIIIIIFFWWKPWYIYFFFQDFLINRKFKRTAFIWNRSLLYYYKSLYKSVTFGQFKASLLNKMINFLQINKWIWIWNKNLFLFFIFRRHTSILLLYLLFTACMLFLYSMYGIWWVDLSFPVWRMQTEHFNISSWL